MKWNDDIIDSIVQAACVVAEVAEEEKALRNIKVGRREHKTAAAIAQISQGIKQIKKETVMDKRLKLARELMGDYNNLVDDYNELFEKYNNLRDLME